MTMKLKPTRHQLKSSCTKHAHTSQSSGSWTEQIFSLDTIAQHCHLPVAPLRLVDPRTSTEHVTCQTSRGKGTKTRWHRPRATRGTGCSKMRNNGRETHPIRGHIIVPFVKWVSGLPDRCHEPAIGPCLHEVYDSHACH